MDDSILNSVKKNLGLEPSYTVFDPDVIMHINTTLSTLNQVGIGPPDGFMIEDSVAKWTDFIGSDKRYNSVKTYVYLQVKTLFDPPTSSFHMAAIKEQLAELVWRLNVHREGESWTDPLAKT